MANLTPYLTSLDKLSTLDRRRQLQKSEGLDFSSNDFLGLKSHPHIRQAMTKALQDGLDLGSGGSRLLRGNHEAFEELEQKACAFFKAPSAMFMANGFLANFALFSTLPQRGDVILMDELIHASAKEGIRASFAKSVKVRHNDCDAYEAEIKRWREKIRGNIWIAVESIYSMDGDMAPLADLMDLANRYDCFLVVDEAHGTGIQGPTGRGLAEAYEGADNLICLHTCGKALGVSGALITCDPILKDFMINASRAFIYTTAPSPVTAIGVQAALDVIDQEPERRQQLLDLANHARSRLDLAPGTQIQPYILGEDSKAVALAKTLQEQGFDVRAVRPPTVPESSARLRISITLNISKSDIDRFCNAVQEAQN